MKIRARSDNGIFELKHPVSGKRISLGTRDRKEAERKALEYFKLGLSETPTNVAITHLSHLLRHTYNTIWSKQKSAVHRSYQVDRISREFNPSLADLESDGYRLVSNYRDFLLSLKLGPGSINRIVSCISKALGEGVKLRLLKYVPPMPRETEKRSKDRFVSEAEENLLLSKCQILPPADCEYMRNLILFLLDTGARLSEALQHRVEGQQAIFENTKNGFSRGVPMTRRARKASTELRLNSHLRYESSKTTVYSTLVKKRNWCIRRFTRVRDAADLPDVSLHTLRHTCASRLVQRGIDLYRVKDWMGHSSIQMTERYGHLGEGHLNELKDVLEKTPTLRSVK